jgi:hypothetical protein
VSAIVHFSRLTHRALIVDGRTLVELSACEEKNSLVRIHLLYKKAAFNYPKFFKMDPLCKAGMLCLLPFAEYLNTHPQASEGGLLFFTDTGCRLTDEEHIRLMNSSSASPAVFVYTLPNIILGEWSIFSRWVGYGQCFLMPAFNALYVAQRMAAFKADFPRAPLVAGWCSVNDDFFEGILLICHDSKASETELAKQISHIYHL